MRIAISQALRELQILVRVVALLLLPVATPALDLDHLQSSFPSLANTEGVPSSIIYGHISVISGDFVDSETDLYVPGPEPLTVTRNYCSHSSHRDALGFAWGWNLGGKLEDYTQKGGKIPWTNNILRV